MLGVMIRKGDVVDGSGGPRRRAGLRIGDGRVVEIGRLAQTSARAIDARTRPYGVRDRAVSPKVAITDVVVFDEATVSPAAGIDHVLISGVPVVDGPTFTEARPGIQLRSGCETVPAALV